MKLLEIVPVRWFNLASFAACAGLLGYAYYSQVHSGLEPCPLCIFQRVGVFGLGLVFLVAGLHNPGTVGKRLYGVLLALVALAGAAVAGRHVWIQSLPPERIPDCGPGLDYILDVFPLVQALELVLRGSGECAEVSWVFLGLSMPAWVLVWFIGLGTLGLVYNWQANNTAP